MICLKRVGKGRKQQAGDGQANRRRDNDGMEGVHGLAKKNRDGASNREEQAGERVLALRLLFHWIDGLGLRLRGFFLRAQEAGEPVV